MFTKIRNGIASAMRWVGEKAHWCLQKAAWAVEFSLVWVGLPAAKVEEWAIKAKEKARGHWAHKLWAWPVAVLLNALAWVIYLTTIVVGFVLGLCFLSVGWVLRGWFWLADKIRVKEVSK